VSTFATVGYDENALKNLRQENGRPADDF
jgi:hypothetical protein